VLTTSVQLSVQLQLLKIRDCVRNQSRYDVAVPGRSALQMIGSHCTVRRWAMKEAKPPSRGALRLVKPCHFWSLRPMPARGMPGPEALIRVHRNASQGGSSRTLHLGSLFARVLHATDRMLSIVAL
jgi:hypothetical protein